ncbi:hypothetical protein ABMA27_011329 [Loxostege sticticalis]|uniref:Uncharacterized protein n=1 Tax=Loxostege sticticalis TaxID=481309 RepID=A0ABR3H2A7_LOXSC
MSCQLRYAIGGQRSRLLQLLLMGTSLISGHSIRKLEINNKTEADVYEIKEDAATNTVAFVNPKVGKPTLREIVYYHMIERPYGGHEEGPDFDDTMRPFTNGHGFPFMESVEKELDAEADNELKEDLAEEIEEKVKEEISPEEKEEIIIKDLPQEDEEEVVYEVIYDEEIKEIPTTVASEILKETSTEATTKQTTEILSNGERIFEIGPAKTARKLLFDRVKERYYSKPPVTQNPSSTSERRKREISMVSLYLRF